ncbi:MAG TPA: acireductone synthase [Candidatus Binatia bacterium]|nr:acireductone synthase [Candidatus Binatia bacterium]
MKTAAPAGALRAVVTDIEGTTSSIDFVHQTLFPYARSHLRAFLRAHAAESGVARELAAVSQEAGRALSVDEAAGVLEGWIDEDRKATPLKALQGMIWRTGYERGELQGHVYEDTPAWLRRWHEQGLQLYVYSSGSVEAQKLIFGHTAHGDLTPLFSGYFDTRIGAKKDAASYAAIAREIRLPPGTVLFLSDIGAELDAARAAGMKTCQLMRDASAKPADGHAQARDFSGVPLG